MCKWNDLFRENSKVIRIELGEKIARRYVKARKISGVYVVRSVSHNKPKSIRRMFDPDKNGILHLGRTANLKGRIHSFLRGTRTGKEHSEAMRYHRHKNEYKKRGYSSVQIGYKELPSRKAKTLELKRFDEYACAFGELPPLNSKRG